MLHIYCPICHGRLLLEPGQKTAVCGNCHNTVPVPRGYTELESGFNYAMEARIRRDFTAAAAAYTDIINQHPDLAAAFWGRALSRYGIEYQSIGNNQYRLVCHQSELKDFSGDEDVRKALSLAEGDEKENYSRETMRISELQAAVSRYAAVTAPYDVIIACSTVPAAGQVQNIQATLNAAGCRTFCPALELITVPRQDWEPMLSRAFSTAQTMVIVAVGKDAFTADLCFDAERFLHRKAKLQRNAAGQIPKLIIAFDNLNEYEDIPDSIFDGADERLPVADVEFSKNLSEIVTATAADYSSALRQEASGHENFEYSNLISSARLSLEGGDFDDARRAYEQVLNYNPRESQAYWGLLLLEHECRNEEELILDGVDIAPASNFKNAVAFATEREQQTYRDVAKRCKEEENRLKEQDQEEERLKREQEEQRVQKEQEVEKAREQKIKSERREKKKGKYRMIVFAAIVVIAAAAGGLYYRQYSTTTGATEKQYKAAQSLYNSFEYKEAAELFQDLGSYKDSEDMYVQSMAEYYTKDYHQAVEDGQDYENRANAIGRLKSALEFVPEAQEQLDEWMKEGEDYYYANGADYTAYQLLYKFGTESQAFIDLWRDALAEGLIAASDDYDAVAILQADGTIQYNECEGLNFEDGSARSVSLSDSADSAAVVRADGTVYVTGKVADKADVSGWTDVSSVQTTDDTVVALTKDGTLLSSSKGTLATGIRQFDFPGDNVIAARLDGTVFCTDSDVEEVLSDWSDVVYVVMEGETMDDIAVLAATSENTLLQYGTDGDYQTTDIVAPYHYNRKLTIRTFDSEKLLTVHGEPSDINVSFTGKVSGEVVYGNSEQDISIRKFIRDIDPVGIPNLTGE